MAANCVGCPYFGSCSGYPIAEEHYNCLEKTPDGGRRCVVERGLFEHIERRVLTQGGFGVDGRFQSGRLGLVA